MTTVNGVLTVTNAYGLTATAPISWDVSDSTRGLITAFNPASDNWNNPENLVIDGQQFFVENANKAWSLTKLDNYTVRMEVRPGDLWADDGTSRSEILTVAGTPVGAVFDASWNMTVEAGAAGTLAWRSSAQVHDGSPFVTISILNDIMNVVVNQANSFGATPYVDTQPIQRGRTYAIRIQLKKSQGTDGFFKMWRDGIQVADYTGVLGNSNDAATMKFGVYQGWDTNVTSPIAIRYDHIAVDFQPAPPPPPLPSGSHNVGVTTLGSTDSGNAGGIYAQKVILTTAATLQSLSFYTNSAVGNLRMGLYSNVSGKPGAKLAETTSAACVAGWNTRSVTPVALQPGTYWLAYEVSSNSTAFRNGGGGQFVWATQSYGTLPATFPSAATGPINDSWSFYMTVLVP